jgi:putative ATPase
VPQQFLPDALKDTKFYEPSERGFEKRIREFLAWLKS